MTVVNSGLISGLVGGGGNGIFGDTVTVTNNASGTITADGSAISANTGTINNYGTISAPVAGGGGTASTSMRSRCSTMRPASSPGMASGYTGSQNPGSQ